MSNPENTLQHSKSITQMLEDQLKKDFEADFRAGSDNTQQWLNVKLRLVGTQYASDEVYFAYRFYKAAHARYSPQMAAPQGFNVLAHNRTTGEWLYKNHADQWQNCPAPFHTPQPVVPESDILPLVWMRPEDAARTMIAAEGERAEVAPDKEGDFDVPLYRHPQPAQVNQQLLEALSHGFINVVYTYGLNAAGEPYQEYKKLVDDAEAFLTAQKTGQAAKAGDGEAAPPCDCIEKVGGFFVSNCYCRNIGDAQDAQTYCVENNTAPPATKVNQQLPEGYVLAPVEPTEAMIDAGVAVAFSASVHGKGGWNNYMNALYRAFIAAAQEVGNE